MRTVFVCLGGGVGGEPPLQLLLSLKLPRSRIGVPFTALIVRDPQVVYQLFDHKLLLLVAHLVPFLGVDTLRFLFVRFVLLIL